ncbi:DEAD/DEAH box helicase [Kribbella sp. HUAS MG21]|uniref:DEAD/DEAH box helicase n=1 Tax=Kribbella sp. HUAS MG21 TaxID=3160966 RepID=A0AAU7T5L4_9ACTN
MFDAVFVPADPPRAGRLALYGDLTEEPDGSVELVLPRGATVRRTTVPARLLTMPEVLDRLTSTNGADEPEAGSWAAWRAAGLAGLVLIGRGRLVPDQSPEGYGAWRVAPLDPLDHAWLRNLGAALPPYGHAIPIAGSRPLRLVDPEQLVRAFWDALADTIVRSPAAAVAARPTAAPFAAAEPTQLTGPTTWLDETALAEQAGTRLVLRIEPPADSPDPEGFRAVLQLRSGVDPSLLVDVADMWNAPAAVLTALGERAETDLLLGLRRGARVWPPLGAALRDAAPEEVPIDDAALEELAEGSDALEGAGIEVLWPAELFAGELALRATVATPTPGAVTGPDFSLHELVQFRWQPSLDGQDLTEAEIAALAEAKRPMIRMRGRWIRVDRDVVRRLRNGSARTLTGAEALGAALTGTIDVDGELVPFEADGSLAQMLARLRSFEEPAPFSDPVGLRATLRDYQRRGVAWMAQLARLGLGGCLADDMGLGKTIQVIALHLELSNRGPTVVVCPSTLLGTWEREFERFAPDVPIRRYHGPGRTLGDLAPDEVVLTTYGVVRQDHRLLGEIAWGLAVADEAQHAKNPLSRTARALRTLPSATRIALTGTPVENRLSELWSILDWSAPGLLGTLDRFRHDVAVPVERFHDEEATARLARVTRPFLLRRRKSDPGIAPELPRKSERDVVVPLTTEQATLYQAVAKETLAKIESAEGIARRGLVLSLLTQLKQVCNHPAQFLHEPGPLERRSGKLAALDELLDVILAEGESVLIFSQYVEMCRLIEAHLAARQVRTLFLHGGIGVRKREQLVEEFQSGAAQVFLLSLKAGGVGLTLTRATHVVHYDRWWNPAVEDQATDRAYRIGQDRPVQVHRLVTENTLEDRIATVINAKRDLADAVVGSGEAWLSELSDAELTELVELSTGPVRSGSASAYNPSAVGKSDG